MNGLAKKVLTTAAVLTAALVIPATSAQASPAGTYAIFYDNANFVGSSLTDGGDGGQCYNLPADWQHRVSSVDSNTHWILYARGNCWFDGPGEMYESWNSVSYVGNAWNDRAASVRVF